LPFSNYARFLFSAIAGDSCCGCGAPQSDSRVGVAFKARVRAMGIRDRPTSFRSPWQNGYAERFIGSIGASARII